MKKKVLEHKIPTWGAIILLIISLWITTYLIRSTAFIVSHASPDPTPHNVMVVNVSDSSFSVAYTTTSQNSGAVSVIQNGNTIAVGHDIRDSSAGNQGSYYSHLITISHLKPHTPYEFSILSNTTIFLNHGKEYSVTTGQTLQHAAVYSGKINGSITFPNGNEAQDTLVVLKASGAQTVATLTYSRGKYSFDLTSLRNQNFSDIFPISQTTQGTLSFFYQTAMSTLQLYLEQSTNLPIITLSSNYDFTQGLTPAQTPTSQGGLTLPTPNPVKKTISITSPNPDANLTDPRPLFQGLALPNQVVTIIIHSDAGITTTVAADKNGLWSYRPPSDLSVGNHTITIKTPNSFKIIQTISENFSILPSGVQVVQLATPSATPIFTPTPTETALSTPTPTILAEESMSPTPTPTISPLPTATLAPTPTEVPFAVSTPQPTIPPTGNNTAIVLTGVSILFILSGASLLFLL